MLWLRCLDPDDAMRVVFERSTLRVRHPSGKAEREQHCVAKMERTAFGGFRRLAATNGHASPETKYAFGLPRS
jgi:hypothetical protein